MKGGRNAIVQQGSERPCRHRMAEIVALPLVAMLGQKKCHCSAVSTPSAMTRSLRLLAHADHGADNGGIVGAAGDLLTNDWSIFRVSIGNCLKIAQAGIARAEVIDRKLAPPWP